MYDERLEELISKQIKEEKKGGSSFETKVFMGRNTKVLNEQTIMNPYLRPGTKNAREFDEYNKHNLDDASRYVTQEEINAYSTLANLESILECYVDDDQYINGKFNIFIFADEELDELIKRNVKNSKTIDTLDDVAKTLRGKHNYNICNSSNNNSDDFDCY